jgi:hypothetical protein
MIRLESDPILLLERAVLTRMYIRNLDIYPMITLGVQIRFLFVFYISYHAFRFIWGLDFTPCLTCCSDLYRKNLYFI